MQLLEGRGLVRSVGTPLPPPGHPPPIHELVGATTYDLEHRTELGGLLRAAEDLDGLLASLADAGYDVREVDELPRPM